MKNTCPHRLSALKRTGGGRDSDSDSDTEGGPPPLSALAGHAPPDFALEPPGAELRQVPPPLLPPGNCRLNCALDGKCVSKNVL